MSVFGKYHDKAVALYGAGQIGVTVLQRLYSEGAHVFLWDDNEAIRQKLENASVKCTPPSQWPWEELALIVPDVSTRTDLTLEHEIIKKAEEHDIDVFSHIELFAQELALKPAEERPKIVAVSGSHGKTVTAQMIAYVMEEAGRLVYLCDQRKVSPLSLEYINPMGTVILEVTPKCMAFTHQFKADASVLLNMTGVDVKFFGSAERSIQCATRIFKNQAEDDALIIGVDDNVCQKLCTSLSSRDVPSAYGSQNIIPISGEATIGHGIFSLDAHVFDARHGKSIGMGDLSRSVSMFGPHINQNVAATYAACLHLGLHASQVAKGLMSWKGANASMKYLGELDGTILIDDSRSSTYRSLVGALKSQPNIVWIGGGEKLQGDYRKLKRVEDNVEKAFLFGPAGEELKAIYLKETDAALFSTYEEAIQAALSYIEAQRGQETVGKKMLLLSPGAVGAKAKHCSKAFLSAIQQKREEAAA